MLISSATGDNNSNKQQQSFAVKEVWKSIDLSDQQKFDTSLRYRIKLSESGYFYPVFITEEMIGLVVSTAQFAFGVIECNCKQTWHYRQMGNVAKRVPNYENSNWLVYAVEYATFEFIYN
ncbi:hypothetical protein ABK040_011124 [Willaertia magna]